MTTVHVWSSIFKSKSSDSKWHLSTLPCERSQAARVGGVEGGSRLALLLEVLEQVKAGSRSDSLMRPRRLR